MPKLINKDNVAEAAEEIKQLLMTSTDVNLIIDKLVSYGIYLNKVVDGQKVIDLTFACFDTDRFHQLLLDYASNTKPLVEEEHTSSDGQDQKTGGQEGGGEVINESGLQVLSKDQWNEALKELEAAMQENDDEEEHK